MSVIEPRHCPTCGEALGSRYFDGRERAYCAVCEEYIFHLPSPCAGVAITRDDEILLIHRGNRSYRDTWALPGGLIEWDEHPRETAVRELAEETGVEVSADDLTLLNAARREVQYRNISSIGFNYVISYTATSGEPSPGEEVQDAQFWTLDGIDQSDEELRPGERSQIHRALQWEAENR